MSEHKNHLDRAYGLGSVAATRDFYADWAETYDDEIGQNGYATPARCAAAIAKLAPLDSAVLDVGCGTGLSGQALKAVGFSTLDGCDMTAEMLERASARNIYRNLWVSDPQQPLDFTHGPYDVVAAIGVIGIGAAPIDLFYDILKQMHSGAHFVFSFNDQTLDRREFEGAVMNAIDGCRFDLLFKDYGPHFPERKINSKIYVLRKR